MYEKHKLRIHQIIFGICILFYLVSPSYSSSSIPKETVTVSSGYLEKRVDAKIQAGGKEIKSEVPLQVGGSRIQKVPTCDADCKIRELIRLGIRSEISTALVTNCKALARDPLMCVKIGASIVKNESGGGYKCRKYNQYNCFGLQVKDNYISYNDGVLHWVGKYEKRWYKAKNMSFFYSSAGNLPPSRYCTSEDSSNTAIGCPHGLKISTDFFNSLPF